MSVTDLDGRRPRARGRSAHFQVQPKDVRWAQRVWLEEFTDEDRMAVSFALEFLLPVLPVEEERVA